MESSGYHQFLEIWGLIMWAGVAASGLFAVILFLFHLIKTVSISDPKKKYDYLSTREVKIITGSIMAVGIGVALYVNTLRPETVRMALMWFFIRLFIGICFGTLIAYVAHLIIKYVYPSALAKKLRKLRYVPRVNPKTGNKMRLLSEDEEDVHLDEGMQAEEKVFSVDYDVWIDEASGDIKIEKYSGHLEAQECDRCGFQTLKLEEEEIVTPATEENEGELIKHYKCSYCGRIRRTAHNIAKIGQKEDSYKLPEKLKFKDEVDREILHVEMRLIQKDGSTRNYDFDSVDHAREFLEELKPKEESVLEEG